MALRKVNESPKNGRLAWETCPKEKGDLPYDMGDLHECPNNGRLTLRKRETCKRALKTGDLPYEKMETCKRAL